MGDGGGAGIPSNELKYYTEAVRHISKAGQHCTRARRLFDEFKVKYPGVRALEVPAAQLRMIEPMEYAIPHYNNPVVPGGNIFQRRKQKQKLDDDRIIREAVRIAERNLDESVRSENGEPLAALDANYGYDQGEDRGAAAPNLPVIPPANVSPEREAAYYAQLIREKPLEAMSPNEKTRYLLYLANHPEEFNQTSQYEPRPESPPSPLSPLRNAPNNQSPASPPFSPGSLFGSPRASPGTPGRGRQQEEDAACSLNDSITSEDMRLLAQFNAANATPPRQPTPPRPQSPNRNKA